VLAFLRKQESIKEIFLDTGMRRYDKQAIAGFPREKLLNI